MYPNSRFEGGTLEYILLRLAGLFVSTITFGLAAAWAVCLIYRFEIDNTVVEGRRLQFDGKAMDLFWKTLVWVLLTIITLGIYSLFIPVQLQQWKVSHTTFAN